MVRHNNEVVMATTDLLRNKVSFRQDFIKNSFLVNLLCFYCIKGCNQKTRNYEYKSSKSIKELEIFS